LQAEKVVKKAGSILLPFAFCLLPFYFFLSTAGRDVRGKFELINPRIKDRGGQQDASGIVFWLAPINGAAPRASSRSRKMIRQSNKRFSPHVIVLETGSEVDFPNEDPFFHNVFSVFNGRRFDLGLYASGESRPVNFNRPGVSYIFCNIHPQMSAVVVTVDTPFYGISDQSGNFLIRDVPEGHYRFNVWYERSTAENLAELTRSVQVTSSGLDLRVIKISEEGYIPRPHPNKFGQEYDKLNDRSGYRRP
jgi:plastocyanin